MTPMEINKNLRGFNPTTNINKCEALWGAQRMLSQEQQGRPRNFLAGLVRKPREGCLQGKPGTTSWDKRECILGAHRGQWVPSAADARRNGRGLNRSSKKMGQTKRSIMDRP